MKKICNVLIYSKKKLHYFYLLCLIWRNISPKMIGWRSHY